MTEVKFAEQDIVSCGKDLFVQLKESAYSSSKRRARFCLHRTHADPVQEMLIGFCKDSLVWPHRHKGKSESFHMIEGEMAVIVFNDEGEVTDKIELAPFGQGKNCICRISRSAWHLTIPLSDYVVVHETNRGPFKPYEQERPFWGPVNKKELRELVDKIMEGKCHCYA